MARSKKTSLDEQPNEVLDTGTELTQPEAEELLSPQSEWDEFQPEDSAPLDFQSDLDPCSTEDTEWPDPQTDPELRQGESTDEPTPGRPDRLHRRRAQCGNGHGPPAQ